jgi:hypothetical protein
MGWDAFAAATSDRLKNTTCGNGVSDPSRPSNARLNLARLSPGPRLRIEHASYEPFAVAKFKQLKVIASMQPTLLTDMKWAEGPVGRSARLTPNAWRNF